jgi:serine/threonine protein kinase
MAAPSTQFSFQELLLKSRLVTDAQLNDYFPDAEDRADTSRLADGLVKAGLLTRYHVQMLQAGKYRGFFLGPYKILRPIGQGGMGTVFLAEHTSLSRKVAVKVLPPDKAKDKLTLERFNREARAAAALDHPNIVRLHDISQGNGVHFLVMEYVEGTDLQSLMGQTGPLHYAQAAQYVAQAAAGLLHAHEKGFIHRDIKPANLMLTKTGGGIKILDMGLARSFTDSKDALTATLAEGDIAGTVDYLSPEQAMNQPLDERSDIYSLGATFYSLVTGHPPFKGTTAQKLMQHQLKEPPSVSLKLSGRVPQALSDVISKMMAKRQSERFQSAADVIDALGPWLPVPTTGNIVTDPSVTTPMPGRRSGMTLPIRKSSRMRLNGELEATPVWKKPAVLIGAAVGLLLLVGGVIAAVALSGGKPADPTTPRQPDSTPPVGGPSPAVPTNPAYKPPYTKIEFAGLTPTSARVGGNGKGEVVQSLGGQRLPAGVIVNHFDGDSVGEYSVAEVNGATALGLRQTNRRDGVQVHFFNDGTLTRMPEGARATLRLTYSLDGTGEGGTAYELTGEPYTKYAATKLPPTGGKWKTVDLAFTRPTGGKGYELIVNTGHSPSYVEGTLYVRSAEVLPADAPPLVVGAVYEFDAGKVAPFRRTGQVASENGYHEFKADAPGWSTEVYDPAGKGDFTAVREGSGGAVGVAATGEKNASQLAFRSHELPADPIEEGKRYTAVLEYRTDRGVEGYTSAQTMDDWKTIGGATLSDTAGEWRTSTYSFTRPAGSKVQLTVGPKVANGRFVWVRKVYLTRDDASAKTPTPTPTPKTTAPVVAVKADFAAFKDGTTPLGGGTGLTAGQAALNAAGWSVDMFTAGDTGELTVAAEGGAKVVTLTNRTGEGTAQLYQTTPGGTLAAGGAYLLKLEYKATEGTTGRLEVREKDVGNWKDCPFSFPLAATGDKWETRTFEVEAGRDYPTVFVLQNLSGATDNRLSVRKLELVPVGK